MAKVKIHSVKFNVLMNMVLTSSQFIFPLITIPYVSRVLGTNGTGAVAFAQSVAAYFSLAALLGIQVYGIRACSSVRDDARVLATTVKELLVILLVSTTVMTIVYIACLFVVPKMAEDRPLFLLFGLNVWLASFGVEWFYQALEQYGYITARSIAFKFIGLLLMFLIVRTADDYFKYGITVIVAGYGSNILNMIRLHSLVDFNQSNRLRVSRHFRPMLMFAVASTSSNMYVQADTLCLGFLGTNSMVGLYQLVTKIKSVLVSATNAVGNAMLPRFSYYSANGNSDKLLELTAKNIDFVAILSACVIAGCTFCARPVVLILGGEQFLGSALPLMLISPAVMFSALNIILGNRLVADNRESEWAVINLIGLGIALLLNVTLIPILGVPGAALSATGCEFFVFLMRAYRSRVMLRSLVPYLDVAKIAACGVVAWALTASVAFTVFAKHGLLLSLIAPIILFGFLFMLFLYLTHVRLLRGLLVGKVSPSKRHAAPKHLRGSRR